MGSIQNSRQTLLKHDCFISNWRYFSHQTKSTNYSTKWAPFERWLIRLKWGVGTKSKDYWREIFWSSPLIRPTLNTFKIFGGHNWSGYQIKRLVKGNVLINSPNQAYGDYFKKVTFWRGVEWKIIWCEFFTLLPFLPYIEAIPISTYKDKVF